MEIRDSVAVITGGASGLGLGAGRHLLEQGASVALLDINEEVGTDRAEELGEKARFFRCDVRDADDVQAAVAAVAEHFGGIDILVGAAGVAPAQRVVARDGTLFDLDLYRFVIDVNLVGLFDVIRNTAGFMAANEPGPTGERGVIINVASIAAYDGQVGQAAYSASKGGVVGMTLPLARDLASSGIRVMTVAPGIMDTPLLAGAPQELKDTLVQSHVFPKRLGTVEEFGALVESIVTNEMLNGEVIRLDAGARMPPR